ncbi:hypothetical protein ACFMJX_01240 [Acinetobacter baumannii]
MPEIQIIAKDNHKTLVTTEGTSAKLSEASVVLVKLPFPMPNESNQAGDAVHNQVRPKPEQYADRTWMPPRGTRRSMGKR